MKREILIFAGMMVMWAFGDDLPDGVMTEEVDGVVWYYQPNYTSYSYYGSEAIPDEVMVGQSANSYSSSDISAVPTNTVGAVVVPSVLGGKKVGAIAGFKNCRCVTSITIPASVARIDSKAFKGCRNLMSVVFQGDAPDAETDIFSGVPKRLVVSVPHGSIGWNGGVTTPLPESWCGRAIVHEGECYDWDGGRGSGVSMATLNVTNTVIHYIVNSVQPERVVPATMDSGFVTVITEVKSGGAVSVPETWSQNYPTFTAKFGLDFTKALMKPTNKRDGAGNPMLVWQDYVAGTDPTKEDDVFNASITLVEGKPVVSCTPELTDAEKELRKYTTWGKVRLQDESWVEVPVGREADYNFYRVTVEMK